MQSRLSRQYSKWVWPAGVAFWSPAAAQKKSWSLSSKIGDISFETRGAQHLSLCSKARICTECWAVFGNPNVKTYLRSSISRVMNLWRACSKRTPTEAKPKKNSSFNNQSTFKHLVLAVSQITFGAMAFHASCGCGFSSLKQAHQWLLSRCGNESKAWFKPLVLAVVCTPSRSSCSHCCRFFSQRTPKFKCFVLETARNGKRGIPTKQLTSLQHAYKTNIHGTIQLFFLPTKSHLLGSFFFFLI